MARLLVLYTEPEDPAHFARYFHDTHMKLVRELPGLRSCSFGEAGKVGQQPQSFFWVWEGVYDSADAIRQSHASAEGRAVMEDIPHFSPTMPTQFILDND